jgi:hypothetical protein
LSCVAGEILPLGPYPKHCDNVLMQTCSDSDGRMLRLGFIGKVRLRQQSKWSTTTRRGIFETIIYMKLSWESCSRRTDPLLLQRDYLPKQRVEYSSALEVGRQHSAVE